MLVGWMVDVGWMDGRCWMKGWLMGEMKDGLDEWLNGRLVGWMID